MLIVHEVMGRDCGLGFSSTNYYEPFRSWDATAVG